MLDQDAIKTAVAADFDARWKDDVIAQLTLQGFSPAEIAAVEPFLDNIVATITPANDFGLNDYEAQTTAEANTALTSEISDKKAGEVFVESKAKMDAHEVFNAKSTITYLEPKFSGPKFTSPVDIQDASYSTDEDYPNSYGEIDEAKNWYKINKSKLHVELVHASGTSIKIDRDGNVTEHIVGSLKRVIEGDLSEEVKGNCDRLVKGGNYLHVSGEHEQMFSKGFTSTVQKDVSNTVNGDVEDTFNGDYTKKVVGAVDISAGSTVDIAGLDIALNGTSSVEITTVAFNLNGMMVKLDSLGLMLIKGSPLSFVG